MRRRTNGGGSSGPPCRGPRAARLTICALARPASTGIDLIWSRLPSLMSDKSETIEIPPRGTKGGNAVANAMFKIFRPLMAGQIARYRRNAGDKPPKMMGLPTVLLTTVGARSGLERTSVLGGFADGDDAWLIVASNSGAPTHPAWFINLAKRPDRVWLEVGRRKFKANVKSFRGAEREAGLARVVAVSPQYGRYQTKTDREIPVIRLTPAS